MIPGRSAALPLVAALSIGAAGAGAYFGMRAAESARVEAATEDAAEKPAVAVEAPFEPLEAVPAPAIEPTGRRVASRAAAPTIRNTTSTRPADTSESTERRASSPEPAMPPAVEAAPVVASATEGPIATETPMAAPIFDEVTIDEASVIGIRLDSPISSETAAVEDRVTARVSRDVTVDGRTVIPAGSQLEGAVTLVEQGGRFTDRARLGIRFTSIVLADARVPIQTEAIFRDGAAPGREATAKIGASAAVGAILGSAIGGKKGAAIGAAAGAGGGSAMVAASGRNAASIAAGTALTVRLTAPATIRLDRDNAR